jgi:[ribosomal protein S5]-alanine N-acetyltransferase
MAVPRCTRLRFRPYTLDDFDAAFEMFADDYARVFYPQMADRDNVRGWIEWNLRHYEEHGFGLWALELVTSGDFVGDCGLTFQDVEGKQELEIGYHIVSNQRRKGLASEAARASLDHGFLTTDRDIICSIVDGSNPASRTVAERIHTHRRGFVKNGQDMVLYYTLRSSWQGP